MNSPADLDRAALIIQLVCRRFDCSPGDLETRGPRAAMFDWARYVAIHVIHTNTPLPLTFIGHLFNRTLPEMFAIIAHPSTAAQRDIKRLDDLHTVIASFRTATAPRLAA